MCYCKLVLLARNLLNANVSCWLGSAKGVIIKYVDFLEIWSHCNFHFFSLIVFSVNDWLIWFVRFPGTQRYIWASHPERDTRGKWQLWENGLTYLERKWCYSEHYRSFLPGLTVNAVPWHHLHIVNGQDGINCGWHTWTMTKCCSLWF